MKTINILLTGLCLFFFSAVHAVHGYQLDQEREANRPYQALVELLQSLQRAVLTDSTVHAEEKAEEKAEEEAEEEIVYLKKKRYIQKLFKKCVKTEYPNGFMREECPDGLIKTEYPDGRIKIEHPDGRIETKHPDGRIGIQYPNKLVATRYPDGRIEIKYPDGRIETVLLDK